jgi:hypothetical protein
MSCLGPPRRSISRFIPLICDRQSANVGFWSWVQALAHNFDSCILERLTYLQAHEHEYAGDSHV